MPPDKTPRFLKRWIEKTKSRRLSKPSAPSSRRLTATLRRRLPKRLRQIDIKKLTPKNVDEFNRAFRWGVVVLGIFCLSEVVTRTAGVFIRPVYQPPPRKAPPSTHSASITEDYDAILRRNMFNMQGTIPEAFDSGQLDCMSQARPSTQRIALLGTIVMSDETHSVALVSEEGNAAKIAVKKDDTFLDGKYTALKVERRRLCFQVRQTQDLEYVEIPDDTPIVGLNATLSATDVSGIQPVSETDYVVKPDYLKNQLENVNEILQTARAIPYVDRNTGKFQGFLVQSIEPNSPFASLGIRQGDILTSVNDIVLDHAGKGIEAFNRFRTSTSVSLKVIRGGQEVTLSYNVK